MKIKYWLDSGANIHSCHKDEISLDDLGVTLDEWNGMSEDEKVELMQPIAFERADWGFELVEE